jgi:hypothetical protein
MAVVVKNGTPVGSDSQCGSCKFSLVMRGYRESEDVTYCDWLRRPILVPFQVRYCSRHVHKSRPSWDQMEELAIEIRPSATLKPAGFVGGDDSESDVAVAKITATR